LLVSGGTWAATRWRKFLSMTSTELRDGPNRMVVTRARTS
jgi:hypothetical protein